MLFKLQDAAPVDLDAIYQGGKGKSTDGSGKGKDEDGFGERKR